MESQGGRGRGAILGWRMGEGETGEVFGDVPVFASWTGRSVKGGSVEAGRCGEHTAVGGLFSTDVDAGNAPILCFSRGGIKVTGHDQELIIRP